MRSAGHRPDEEKSHGHPRAGCHCFPAKARLHALDGTCIAPLRQLIRDPETYEKFEEVILTHTHPRNRGAALSARICVARDQGMIRFVSYFATGRLPATGPA